MREGGGQEVITGIIHDWKKKAVKSDDLILPVYVNDSFIHAYACFKHRRVREYH